MINSNIAVLVIDIQEGNDHADVQVILDGLRQIKSGLAQEVHWIFVAYNAYRYTKGIHRTLLEIEPMGKIITKGTSSAFGQPEFTQYIDKNDIDTLFVCGFHIADCPFNTVKDAKTYRRPLSVLSSFGMLTDCAPQAYITEMNQKYPNGHQRVLKMHYEEYKKFTTVLPSIEQVLEALNDI